MPRTALGMKPDIGIVVAGNCRDAARRAEVMQPFGGTEEFFGQPEVDQVSGDRDVIRLPLGEVVGEQVEHIAPMHVFAAAMPVHITQHALGEQVAALGARHRAQMDVGKMGEGEQESAQTALLSPRH
jgi:hypothetical protein